MTSIHIAESDEAIARCFPVMQQLRTRLAPLEFVPTVRRQQLGGYRLELDSGVQRFDAHRFYLANRMIISSHHFTLTL